MEKFDISNSLKKSGWMFSLAMLGVVIANIIYAFVFFAMNAFNPTKLATFAIPQIILPITVLCFVSFCIKRLFKDEPKEVFGLKIISIKNACFALVLGLALYFVTNFIGNVIGSILDKLNVGGSLDEIFPAVTSFPIFLLMTFVMCVLPAISEELVYRAAIMHYAKPAGAVFTIVFSALCFGFMHCNFYQLFYAVIAGLIFAVVYFKTKNITIVIIAHFVNNFLSLLSLYLNDAFNFSLHEIFFGISFFDIIMFVVSSAFLIFLFFSKRSVSHETIENPSDGTRKDAVKKAAIGFLFCIVMAILTALM